MHLVSGPTFLHWHRMVWLAADLVWTKLGICDKSLRSPLPLWLGPYFLCGLHGKDDAEAAWRARTPRGKPMEAADVRPGVMAAILYELWKRLHRYHRVLPDGDFKQVVQQGIVKRPVVSPNSVIGKTQAMELLQFNQICYGRWAELGEDTWHSPSSWLDLDSGQHFFGKEASELTHLLTGVRRSSSKRAVQHTQSAAGSDDAARQSLLDRIFAERCQTNEVVSTRETIRMLQMSRGADGGTIAVATMPPAAPAAAN